MGTHRAWSPRREDRESVLVRVMEVPTPEGRDRPDVTGSCPRLAPGLAHRPPHDPIRYGLGAGGVAADGGEHPLDIPGSPALDRVACGGAQLDALSGEAPSVIPPPGQKGRLAPTAEGTESPGPVVGVLEVAGVARHVAVPGRRVDRAGCCQGVPAFQLSAQLAECHRQSVDGTHGRRSGDRHGGTGPRCRRAAQVERAPTGVVVV